MTTPPRVLIVSFIAAPGGAHNLWRHFAMDPDVSSALELHALAPRAYRDADAAPFADGRIAFHSLTELTPPPLRARLLRRMIGGAVPETTRWTSRLESIEPDLVLFNLAGMGDINWCVSAGSACKERGTPYWLILQHAQEDFHFENDDRSEAALALVQSARRVLTVSDRNRRALERAVGAALTNVERGVNGVTASMVATGDRVMRETPIRTTGTARLLCLARFDLAYKGQDHLLEALATPEWRDRDWTLTLQGGGTHERLLRRIVAQHGFAGSRVRVEPHSADVSAAFAAADLLVFPSRSEGTPFALVEGLAHGRPAVVTAVGGNDELVVEGRTGWVASAVTSEALRAALSRAWVARAAWPTAGYAARKHVLESWTLSVPHHRMLASILADVGRP